MPFIQPGDVLCDMHGRSLRHPPQKLTDEYEIISMIEWEGRFHEALTLMIAHAVGKRPLQAPILHNKFLYVVGFDRDDNLIAAYTYDGRMAGMCTLKIRV